MVGTITLSHCLQQRLSSSRHLRAWESHHCCPNCPPCPVSACLLCLTANVQIGGWSLWAALIILCREVLVSGMREFLAELRVGLPVSTVAKWKTTLQLVSIGFLIAGPAGETVLPGSMTIGLTLLWAAALLTLYTGWDYMKAGFKYVED